MAKHIDRIRAFAHWIAQGKGHATQEAIDAMTLLADYDALVDAARDVAYRGPKCDCEMCEDAFDRLRDMLPYEYTNADREATNGK